MSLVSPRRLYVVSHRRPVFIVRRIENDDFMVVSDINAALGLFPQQLIREKRIEIESLKAEYENILSPKKRNMSENSHAKAARQELDAKIEIILKDLTVAVYPLDGEELFARIETSVLNNAVVRRVFIFDFDGNPIPEVEHFVTTLNPEPVRKDFNRSFHETHLHEIPERLRDALRYYIPESGGLPEFDIKRGAIRKRFGKDYSGLKRIVLMGTGSALNMARIALPVLFRLMPDLDVISVKPGNVDDLSQILAPGKDLAIMMSWSSTTAEMVIGANQLVKMGVLTIGITEKRFAEMALITARSGGTIHCLSGEEVTVSGIKSTVCMLYSLILFGVWLAAQRGRELPAQNLLDQLELLPDKIETVLEDPVLFDFSAALSSKYAGSRAVFAIGAPEETGMCYEIVKKLEEASWTTIGKTYTYTDLLHYPIHPALHGNFVIVTATRPTMLQEALRVMEVLHRSNVPFAAVTIPNRNRALIEFYSNGQCIFLERVGEMVQSFIDLLFSYRLAYDYGIASGRHTGEPPRNIAKSLTVSRKQPGVLSSTGEFEKIKQQGAGIGQKRQRR